MAITTLDGVISGFTIPQFITKIGTAPEAAGVPYTFWYNNGRPGAATASSAGVNGEALSAPVTGMIFRTDPVSGNAYLGRLAVTANAAGMLLLIDRLWQNSGLSVTSTTAQAITPATIPSRDSNGTTNGDGVMAAIEWSAAGGAGTPTVTLTYTDQDGNTGATAAFTAVTTPVVSTFEIFPLAAGDSGIRAPTSFIQSATRTSGTMHLVLFRVIAALEISASNIGNAIDALTGGMPRIYDDSVLQLVWIPTGTGAVTVSGTYVETQG